MRKVLQNIWITADQCTGCGICAELCPHHCIAMTPRQNAPTAMVAYLRAPQRCTDCESCVQACPVQAIVGYK